MIQKIKNLLQERINKNNRRRLRCLQPCLVCSNCTGGFLYHWLGLEFRSPFINLYLTPSDFILALENWSEFINGHIYEVRTDFQYPVGEVKLSVGSVFVHFMHYPDFITALNKWNERKERMPFDVDNIGFMLTNWDGDETLLERFDRLPFKHKVAFAHKPFPALKSVVCLRGFEKTNGTKNIYATHKINGKRYIDQFDYVGFINSLNQ